jgi:hypothetical protein
LVIARGAATGDNSEPVFVEALANSGSDTAHTTGDVSNFIRHEVFL